MRDTTLKISKGPDDEVPAVQLNLSWNFKWKKRPTDAQYLARTSGTTVEESG
jgi:hypothetical protein